MILQELVNEDEILAIMEEHRHDSRDDDTPMQGPLFCGTDESLVNMSKEERDHIRCSCETLLFAVFDMFVPDVPPRPFKIDLEPSIKTKVEAAVDFGEFWRFLDIARYRKEQKTESGGKYQYGDLYVTTDIYTAVGYSKYAWICGETGKTAWWLVAGAKAAGFDLRRDPELSEAFDVYEKRRSEPKKPAVLMFVDVDGHDLEANSGGKFSEYVIRDKIFRTTMRLTGLKDDAMVYIIKEENHDALLRAWKKFKGYTGRYWI